MLTVDFKFNAGNLQKVIMKKVVESLAKRVEAATCPEHGQHAHLVATGSTPANLEFEVKGCCEQLTEMVRTKLKG